MKVLLIWLVTFCSASCLAHTGNTVQVFRVSNNHLYSVPMIYHSLIRYYIDPDIMNVTFRFRGRTYPVNTQPYIEEAMRQWSQATAGLQFPLFFTSAATPEQANLRISAISREQDVPSWVPQAADGYSIARDEFNSFAQLNLIVPRISGSLEDSMEMIDSVDDLDTLIRVWFRHFFLHEMGHVLGIDHPDNDRVEDVQHQHLPNVYLQVRLNRGAEAGYASPHIMSQNLAEYIGDRSDQLDNHPINEHHVVLSEVEIAAFRYAMTALEGACLPSRSAHLRHGGDGSVRCSLATPHLSAAVSSLLLN